MVKKSNNNIYSFPNSLPVIVSILTYWHSCSQCFGSFSKQVSLYRLYLLWMQSIVKLSQLCQASIVYCPLSTPTLYCFVTLWQFIILVQITINTSGSIFPRVESFGIFFVVVFVGTWGSFLLKVSAFMIWSSIFSGFQWFLQIKKGFECKGQQD